MVEESAITIRKISPLVLSTEVTGLRGTWSSVLHVLSDGGDRVRIPTCTVNLLDVRWTPPSGFWAEITTYLIQVEDSVSTEVYQVDLILPSGEKANRYANEGIGSGNFNAKGQLETGRQVEIEVPDGCAIEFVTSSAMAADDTLEFALIGRLARSTAL